MRNGFPRTLLLTTVLVTGLIYFSLYHYNPASAEPAVSLIQGNSYDKEWRRVDSLTEQGLYKSALELTNQIYAKAKKEINDPQVVKSLIYRFKLEDAYVEQSADRSIYTLREELKTAQGPLRPVLHHMLASMYWQYYQNNRWTFYQRSQTIRFQNDSVNTWDLNKLVSATIHHYNMSLENPDSLRKISGRYYAPVITDGDAPADLRPTLYDFLAHPAIDFFASEEPGVSRPADHFVIDDPAYFKQAKDFVQIKLETKDSLSMKFHALKHLQQLIGSHLNDTKKDAFIMADLKRLKFVQAHSVLADKDSLYEDALRQLAANNPENPYTGEVLYEVAVYHSSLASKYDPLQGETNRYAHQRALELCMGIMDRYPGTLGASKALSLKQNIESKNIHVTAEQTAVPQTRSRILIKWKNVKQIWFRAAKLDEEPDGRYNYISWDQQVKDYLKKPVVSRWDVKLPDTKDYQQHTAEAYVPELPPGHYAIIGSASDSFATDSNGIAIAEIWVSSISYLQRRMEDGSYEVYCYNRSTGDPLPNVDVTMWEEKYDYGTRNYEMKKTGAYTGDKNGKLTIPAPASNYRNFILEFKWNKNHLYSDYTYQYKSYREKRVKRPTTFFFTDRAIYRPGQIVYFKGIIINSDGEDHSIMPEKSTTVTLYDVNYQKVATLDLVTNEYGSFSGSFTAPLGGLTGQMHIQNESGSVYFSVEEYKRPHFEVTMDPVKTAFRLNDNATVTGVARSFSGAPVDGAQVKYRVVRTARFPWWWWCWRGYYPSSGNTEIANGVVTTNDTGGFVISFQALPDKTVPKESDPVFTYAVYTDVTDITGETHSGTGYVHVGYKSVELTVPVPEMVEKSDTSAVSVNANNLNGEPEPSLVNIIVHKLEEPSQVYRARQWNRPDQFIYTKQEWNKMFPSDPYNNENDRSTWKKGKQVLTTSVNTASSKKLYLDKKAWESGTYVMESETKDKYGQIVKDLRYFIIYGEKEKSPYAKVPFEVKPIVTSGEPGKTASFLVATSLKGVKLAYEIEHKNKIVSREILRLDNEMRLLEIPIQEKHRGNFAVHFSFVYDNRGYTSDHSVYVPYESRNLDIEFETFRDKMLPGSQEEWKVKIRGPKGEKVLAEMVAAMYDASLDEFRSNYFSFYLNQNYYGNTTWQNEVQGIKGSQLWDLHWNNYSYWKDRTYDHLNWYGYHMSPDYRGYWGYTGYDDYDGDVLAGAAREEDLQEVTITKDKTIEFRGNVFKKEALAEAPAPGAAKPDANEQEVDESKNIAQGTTRSTTSPGEVKARSNLNETVFFFPHLETDSSGAVIIKFTMNEALTKWKFMAFAHTRDLKYGTIQKEVVTQKELMVVPHAPRFLREGDEITLTSKVSNLSQGEQSGTAQLFLYDALTNRDITQELLVNKAAAQIPFTAKKGQSFPLGWDLRIPVGYGAVKYKVAASAGSFTDAEENALPVLSNRMLVTETMPLPIRGGQKKDFRFEKLINQSNGSSSLVNHRFTLEFTSNPAWYAVQALPYMMEYPYECSEQTFTRYYSNTIASHIANSSPKMKAIFDAWKNSSPDAFLSNLEKNQELKSAVLEETPWVLEAKDESERKRRVGLLFDMNRMSSEQDRTLRKLSQMQVSNGGWPWFEGMPDDRYITQHIICGFGKLDHLGITAIREDRRNWDMVKDGVRYADARIVEDYNWILKWDAAHKDDDHLGYLAVHYLYMRSFFSDIEMTAETKTAFDYYFGQAKKYWTKKGRYMQGMLALSLHRYNEKTVAGNIMKSLRETALVSEELGMYWKDMTSGYYWYQAPIESQALMVEAFHEVSNDQKAVDDIRVWLLKNKQTNDWKTTKATVEACYALLLNGTNWLATESDVTIILGGQTVDPKSMGVQQEAGTGYFKTSWTGSDISPDMGKITVSKSGPGVSWGAVYWQYWEDMDKITPAQTPLRVVKKLFVTRNTAAGPVIEPVTEKTILKPGDKIKVRIELRSDRDMEYVHMKDMRASGFEPVNVFSRYKWQDGLGYYESTRDASTNFFFTFLPKGTYVFEYPLFVAHAGNFSNGITTVQCMYAPEFSAHSEGMRVSVAK